MRIARRFNAGEAVDTDHVPKARLNRNSRRTFNRPSRTKHRWNINPALKRWAIIACPFGTGEANRPLILRKALR